jgi:hypothetical protein
LPAGCSEKSDNGVDGERGADDERWVEREWLLVCRHPGLRAGDPVGGASSEHHRERHRYPDERGTDEHVDRDQGDFLTASERGARDGGCDDEGETESLRTADAEREAGAQRRAGLESREP